MTTDDRTTESAMAVLAELDPAPPAHAGAHLSPRAGQILEQVLESVRDGDDRTAVKRNPVGDPTTSAGGDEFRTRRRRRAWTVGLVGAAAAVLAGALVVLPSVRGGDGDTEAAAWSAIPSVVPADDLSEIVESCLGGLNVPGERVGNPHARDANIIVSERRGDIAVVLLSDGTSYAKTCQFDLSRRDGPENGPRALGEGYGSLDSGVETTSPFLAPFTFASVSRVGRHSDSITVFVSPVAEGVTEVVLHGANGQDATATVTDGFALAWVPGIESEDDILGHGTEATVTFTDGRTERVDLFGF